MKKDKSKKNKKKKKPLNWSIKKESLIVEKEFQVYAAKVCSMGSYTCGT